MNTQLDNQATLDSLFENLWSKIDSISQATINEATRQCYAKIYENMASKIDYENGIAFCDVLYQSKRKNTYYSKLAACRYSICIKLRKEHEKARIAISENDTDTFQQSKSTIHKLKCELAEINAMPPSSQIKSIESRKSKRGSLSGLPVDWRKQLCYRMISSKYFFQTLALAICGCRPHEMKLGILIKSVVVDQIENFVLEIHGAKVTDENGQKYRHLTFSADASNALLSPLINFAKEMGGSTVLKIQNEKAFSSAISRFAAELWPKLKVPITPYSFRHAFASDMKATGDQDTVAQSLGHRSTRTQKRYGQKQLSRSSDHPIPTEILTPFPIRQNITRFSKNKESTSDNGLTEGC
ncbi:site-specific integrase [Undibacterium sp. Di24W]|uniref:site-specific integrase n=1 Tax=Undibacterium sp. Di24W TaxID=3413033 RepID=UPI003BF16733